MSEAILTLEVWENVERTQKQVENSTQKNSFAEVVLERNLQARPTVKHMELSILSLNADTVDRTLNGSVMVIHITVSLAMPEATEIL